MKFFVNFLIPIFISSLLFSQQPEQETVTSQLEKDTGPKTIPVTEITARADEVLVKLTDIQSGLEVKSKIADIETQLKPTLDTLNRQLTDPSLKNLDERTSRFLLNLTEEWNLYLSRLNSWENQLAERTQDLEKAVAELKEMMNVWQLTSDEAASVKAPQAIRLRVKETIKEITAVEKSVLKRFNELLVKQNAISQTKIDINKLLIKISETEKRLRSRIFVRDSAPLWNAVFQERDYGQITGQFQESWNKIIRANIAFVRNNQDRFIFHLMIYLALFILMLYLNRRSRQTSGAGGSDDALETSYYFISRPFSAAFLMALILSIWIYSETTASVSEFIMLLFLIPVLRLTPGILSREFHKPVYFMAGLFVLDVMQKNASGYIIFQRLLLLVATFISIVVILRMILNTKNVFKENTRFRYKHFKRIFYLIAIILSISFLANFIGSFRLSRTITWAIVESAHVFVTLFITAKVTSGLITILVRRRRTQAMQFIKTYTFKIEKWVTSVVYLIAAFIWLRATSRAFGFMESIKKWYTDIIVHQWEVGAITISVEAIIDFILILLATFVLVRFLRILLALEVFPRLTLPKGIPGAITMVMRYILIVLGLFLAFSALGLDLSKFALLAGALGVGLGFGLQKIVANFISSLLIAFGQVIRVGDTVQYTNFIGNVKEIGVNSSVVKAFDGSEVIIPNADLISNNVVNWTLSDNQRRLELPVKVAYENDPHQVIQIMEEVAKKHESVLDSPEPFAIFNGFGDNFLDFTLYYWIYTQVFWKAKNEVALAVHDTLKALGIGTPRPQRDVRLTNGDGQIQKKAVTKKPITKNVTKSKTDSHK
jgi:small-conductance mechanosensitive channel